jgi:hypothetical protein
MKISIDSNQFIFGIGGIDPASELLMTLLPVLEVILPRLVIKEVNRNLTETQRKLLFKLFNKCSKLTIIDNPVPIDIVQKYIKLGLPEKADAFIGAFVEWQEIQIFISDNRHFLNELSGSQFEVLKPYEFLNRFYQMAT